MTALKEFNKALNSEFNLAARDVFKTVKENTPVDTKALKRSHKFSKKRGEFSATISSDLEYAHQIMVLGRLGPGKGSTQLPNGIKPVLIQKYK